MIAILAFAIKLVFDIIPDPRGVVFTILGVWGTPVSAVYGVTESAFLTGEICAFETTETLGV